jgi:hypothetical protein
VITNVELPRILFHTVFKLLEMPLETQSALYSGYNYRTEPEQLLMSICGDYWATASGTVSKSDSVY